MAVSNVGIRQQHRLTEDAAATVMMTTTGAANGVCGLLQWWFVIVHGGLSMFTGVLWYQVMAAMELLSGHKTQQMVDVDCCRVVVGGCLGIMMMLYGNGSSG
ncbi:hypothetical protein QVD17_00166 [Tagetes erecta]|uniref:Uncharacterized protein n=1 Tax=Tagetes erecta TaxID=13708 RepID=A0AAD8L845_TARER|nr:hypothetical protein QVD17_00166 [Tagetes erecta]